MEQITLLGTELNIDDPIQQYALMIGEELKRQEVYIPSQERTATASLLAACRLREYPIRVTVLADHTEIPKEEILSEMQRISQQLEFGIPLDQPKRIIENACRELSLSETIRDRAIELARLGDKAGVTSGVSPYTYSAAVLYVVCSPSNIELSQAAIANHFAVSTATLRNRRDDLLAATGSQLFELQFPDAPAEAVGFVDTLLNNVRDSDWAANKRALGLLGGTWMYIADLYDLGATAGDIATLTGISEKTIQARHQEITDNLDSQPKTLETDHL